MSLFVLPALLDGVSSQQRVDNWVNGLLEVLYEDSVPCHYSLFDHIYIAATTFNVNTRKKTKFIQAMSFLTDKRENNITVLLNSSRQLVVAGLYLKPLSSLPDNITHLPSLP